jgi:hypothetical protein
MCHIVYVSVGGYAGNAAEQFKGHGLVTAPASNPTCAALPAKTTIFEVTAGGCSCSFYSGEPKVETFDIERERRRYRRKGWPAKKVEERVASLRAAHEKNGPRNGRDEYGFVDAIERIARSGARVTLLSHSFEGLFTDPFEIVGTTQLPLQHFLDCGGGFPEDRLVTLVA